MNEPSSFSVALPNEIATAQLMADLALLVGPGDTITLSGDLGAGKTTAARAMIRYLAGDEAYEVPSPTFTLTQTYDLPPYPVLHADLYRIADPSELEEIGLAPLPDGALALIEWPERAPDEMPDNRIDIAFSHRPSLGSAARAAEITGHGEAAAKVARLAALRHFLNLSGQANAVRQRMPGDASTRSYARVIGDQGSLVLMNSPPRPDGPAIHNGRSYSAAVHLAEDVRPFVALANGLRRQGFSAPAVYHADLDAGFLLLEDLGGATFVQGTPPEPIAERYQAAATMLAALHAIDLPDTLPLAPKINYRIPEFDFDAMMVEVGLMLDWYLPDHGVTLGGMMHADFLVIWKDLLGRIERTRKTWMLRDFHSPNLIWLGGRKDIARVGLLDFQDAVMGPEAYDLVSLLQDARIDVPDSVEIPLLGRYVAARRQADPAFDAASFVERYAIMSAQRNTRLLGTFARLNRRDGKPQYLRHQPRIWGYLQRAFAHPTLNSLKDWFTANVPPPIDRI
ncbi:bifunctional tRNA (adenosine(37)-N6)-threonylcarbamoyltransferase complex ATPase subunit type 1 TsaE/phosphotransferase [Afipia felis]|uniref:tRNA threonylcarbamoyladenosine biosynthesis protein TsaE n=2 Tax=Afipia felis TaxID=1035 RepID=A0A380W3W3_AFIFE|nr:bifunctional tRNA (adenosine(37)-N6)-threonylcarbamoyltransferase complex ATPase subunit type 1 TsaE/phosphotransferase [Afipia felis]EKS30084.1 YjeE family ATPase [Afipia felis ATCC 53690]SUU74829.1 ADP-binding protein [Afipia felis]SUU82895.1 ADP-binding protein [Afipia felis]